ncbi:MAG: HDOD domain-containing protein [Planctomycetota bacterium]|jgi:HD-like signal output (HDOD) protein|nr:HDOD domain-containing protein [Planctomycetota bacterium]
MSTALPTVATALMTVTPFSFEQTIRKVELMSRDGDCTTALLAGVLGSDPMLAAAVLSRANATGGRHQAPVTRLSQAVTMLGMSMVQGLVLRIHPIEPAYRRTLAACWGLANATATMTRIVASVSRVRSLREMDEETLHVAGLMHDLGTVVGQRLFTEAYLKAVRKVADDPELGLEDALAKSLGANTAAISTLVCRHWGIPPLFAACMRYLRRPMKADEEHRPVVAAVHVARCLVRGCGFTVAGDPYVEPIDDEALDTLGIRFGEIEDALRMFYDEVDELELYEGVLGA